ncbi:peptidase M26 [Tannerella forsythia]
MKKKTKMKTTNIIQRLCLFLFVLVLAAPAWATDYGREGYKIFRSRELGTHQTVTTLRKGPVEVWFSHCKTSGGTGSGAIYELQKGTRIQIEVDEGYAIRWVILRDTEGGKRYSDPEGIKRISSVTPGYQYYFERNAISNSHISGGNQNQLNDDDNNIVVYNYDAPEKIVYMWSHHNKNWDQFKVRDIIVGYVKEPKVRFDKDKYDIYTVSKSFKPGLNNGEDYGNKVKYKLSNNDIADVKVDGSLMLKRPGTVVLTATCNANKNCAKVECSTTINVMRDRVTFSADGLPYVIFNDAPFDLYRNLKRTTRSGKPFLWGRWWENYNFGIRSSNSEILFYKEHIGLDYDAGKIKFGGTAGEATITLKQEENPFYEATTFSHTFIAMRRDQYGTILIKDANEWKLFCKLVNDKGMTGLNARLEADIDLGSDIAMVGNGDHKYSGTFDGQNHALTMNWNAGNTKDIAPFKKVKDATIRNLRTKGTITSSSYYLSGLIDEVYGKTTISGCVSEVNITSSYNEGSSDVAGMVAYIYSGSVVTFDDCIVKGTLKATTNEGKKAVSGFVHGQHGTCTLTNCLYIGDNNATGGNTFADNATVTNCYYLKACGNKQGEQVTADQLKNGYVAYKLQAGRQYTTWGQAFGSDEPRLTDNVEYRVYKVDFTYNSQVRATRYATRNKHIYGSMPTFTPKDLLGSGYNEHHYYTLAFAEGFNENTTVTFDKRVAINITEKDAYEIGSVANWKEFCNIVSGGQNAVDAKMIADVNLGGDIVMVGAGEHKYSGTFDGREHTLTLNWNSSSSRQLAPFLYVKGATIKNLRVKGDINSNTYGLSGLIYSAYGATTISGCVSNVNLTSSYGNSAGCDASGMVRIVNSGANVTITDCIVKGKFHATTDNGKKGMGGFVYYQGGTCTLTNCLYIGKNNATSNSDTFAKDATVKNCYYLNACGNEQGEKITEEQLKNGEVAYKLQNGRDTQVWGQELGKDDEPRLTDIVTKYIYKVGFVYKGKEKASRYANRGKAIFGGMPTAQDILGTLYDPAKNYTLIFENGFNTVTDVYKDRTVAVSILANNNFDIATKDDWKEFRELVNDRHRNFDAKMTADVDLDSDIVLVGNDIYKYSGTFDGQGHTLTVNWNQTSYSIAPFGGVNGATIKNLHVKGKITASGGNLSGLILFADGGKTSVSGCVIDMDLKGSSDVSGMIYKVYGGAQVTITDCVVKGALNSDNTNQIAGFVNYQDYNSSCTLTNCLYAGENNATERSYTFANRANLNNCYYLNACGEAQGEQVTEEQLKNGYVAHKLQAGRTDQCYWAQVLGEMPSPYRETGKAETNYVYYNKENNRWACDDFRLADGKPLPIGIDFTAAKASYERDLSIGKATLCLPYDLYAQGFKAYTLSGGNKNEVHFKEVNDKLTAYTPYYITANGMPQLGGRNIEVKAYKADKMTTPAAGYKFTGTVAGVSNATAAAANAYILQDDGMFHKVTTENTGATIPAYRAYIICPKASGAKELSVILDGETTGIDGVKDNAAGVNGPVYDLQGRRVADRLDDAARHRLPAGVYIVGGRKVVVK